MQPDRESSKQIEPKPDPAKQMLAISQEQSNDLVAAAFGDLSLGLTPEQEELIKSKALKQVTLQLDLMRVCDASCPAHDICVLIREVPDVKKRPYGKRCPIEAMRYKQEFDNFVAFVTSIDPSNSPIPAVEMGLCKEVAFLSVMEHRAQIELGVDPELTQQVAIPGGGGAVGKQENPAYKVFSQIAKDKRTQQQALYKLAQERVKRVKNAQDSKAKSLGDLFNKFKEMKADAVMSPLGRLVEEAASNIEENEASRRRKGESSMADPTNDNAE